MFLLLSDYGVDGHFLLSGVRPDGSPFLNDGEAARTLENVENLVFRIAYVLVKVFGYLYEVVHVHAHFRSKLVVFILGKQKRYEMEINIENPQKSLSSVG